MGMNLAHKLIAGHLVEGRMEVGAEIGLTIDQTLTQDATGTLVMLELEAMRLPRVKTELSAQYVDHNLLQTDFKNADDHLFLRSACQKFGHLVQPSGQRRQPSRAYGTLRHSRQDPAGLGQPHLRGRFARHAGHRRRRAGGGAQAMAGEPFYLKMPRIWGVRLTGALPDWVSAKDVILEMLRRHGVAGGVGKIIEYYGPGLACLSAMDRHVIANMGAELGATTTVFPSDSAVSAFWRRRGAATTGLSSSPTPMRPTMNTRRSTCPPWSRSSPAPAARTTWCRCARWRAARSTRPMIGSSANPGLRDFAVAALMVDGQAGA